MDYSAKSMAVTNTAANVDINVDMDDVLKRIQSSRNVAGVMVINNEGIPLKSTLDSSTTVQYGGMVSDLASHARWSNQFIFFIIWRHEQATIKLKLIFLTPLKFDNLFLSDRSIVRDLDPSNELTFLRVKSAKHEVLVAPDEAFTIIVLQNTREEE